MVIKSEQNQQVSSFCAGQVVLAKLQQPDLFSSDEFRVEPQVSKPKRVVGRASLSNEQVGYLRAHMLDMLPCDFQEFGFAEGYWTPKVVQQLVQKKWSIDISISTARAYIQRLGFASPRALPRQANITNSHRSWLVDRLPSLRVIKQPANVIAHKGSPKKRPVVWLSCKATQQGDLLRDGYVQMHAVANTGKAAFVALSDTNQESQVSSFLTSLADSNTLFVFDESVIEHFGQHALKGKAKPDSSKYGSANAKHVMRLKVFRYLKKLMPRDVVPVGYNPLDDLDDRQAGGTANRDGLSDQMIDQLSDNIANRLVEWAFECCWFEKKNPTSNDESRDDHVAWITSESDEVHSFNWCVRLLGLTTRGQRESFRAAGLREAAASKGIDPVIRGELLELADEYA